MFRTDPFIQADATFDVGFDQFLDVTWPLNNKLVIDNYFPDVALGSAISVFLDHMQITTFLAK